MHAGLRPSTSEHHLCNRLPLSSQQVLLRLQVLISQSPARDLSSSYAAQQAWVCEQAARRLLSAGAMPFLSTCNGYGAQEECLSNVKNVCGGALYSYNKLLLKLHERQRNGETSNTVSRFSGGASQRLHALKASRGLSSPTPSR